MIIDYEDLYIKLGAKLMFGKITEKEKKIFDKLEEWLFNDDVDLDNELEDIDE
ncbi:hypothetical protein [uncultured Clostridium sp.]|uniref:hypothetical protein n=1 Tax=uncultured Clostridium sp. TaxID=59620 RepID=UPI0032172635